MVSFASRLRSALALFALLAVTTGAVGAQSTREPYEIDAILSLTGPFAFLGNSEAESLRTLEPILNREGGINGRPIHFAISDDQSQPAVAVQLANAIIAKKPAIMLGPTYVASCLAVAPLVRTNGPVQYCFAPTIHPPAGSYTFSGGASSDDQAVDMLTFATAKGYHRIATIATTDATGQDVEGSFQRTLKTGRFSKIDFVTTEHFAQGDVSISAQLARVKASNPDAILMDTVGAATGTVLRSLRDAGLDNVPVLTNLGNLIHSQLDQYVAFMPKTIYFTAPRFVARDVSRAGPVRDQQIAFYRAFNVKGIDPDVGNNFPWDPARILVSALRKLGPNATPKEVLDYVEPLHGFPGVNGLYDYRGGDQRGQGVSNLVIVTWVPEKKSWRTVSEPGGKPLAANGAK